MTKLDDILVSLENLHLDSNAYKQKIKELMLELIGEDESTKNCGGGVYAVRIAGKNNVRAALRQKVEAL